MSRPPTFSSVSYAGRRKDNVKKDRTLSGPVLHDTIIPLLCVPFNAMLKYFSGHRWNKWNKRNAFSLYTPIIPYIYPYIFLFAYFIKTLFHLFHLFQ